MNNYLQEKIKTLPPAVGAYLTSIKSDDLNVLIAQKYNLTLPQIRVYSDLVAQLFLKEISPASLVEEIKHIFGFSDSVANQMACDIAGVRLLVVSDWLGTDVAALIKSWGGDPTKYQGHVDAQHKAIPKEEEWLNEQLAEPVDTGPEPEETDWQEEENRIKELFKNNLVAMLNLDDDFLLDEINSNIFYLISNLQTNFGEELAALLVNNNERLTAQSILLDDKQVEPTVANWLAYFFSQKGSALFDALTLSDFITNSPNAKLLSPEEKRAVTNLLTVYRNLKFFPASMSGPNPEDWFIFPLAVEDKPLVKPAISGVPEIPSESVSPVAAATPANKPSNFRDDTQIKELESMAARYPDGSLERLALEEEIARLRK